MRGSESCTTAAEKKWQPIANSVIVRATGKERPLQRELAMRFRLIPREMRFFDMFDETTAVLRRASDKFLSLVTEFNYLTDRTNELRQEERACDEVVGRIIKALDQSFITPFDREDIHTLATSLDDVLDNMEETANRFVMFRIDKPTP